MARKRPPDAPNRVLGQWPRYVHIAARYPDVRVPEHLLNYRQGDAFAQSDRGRRVPHCVHARMRDASGLQDRGPLAPVRARVDGLAIRLAKHKRIVLRERRLGRRAAAGHHPGRGDLLQPQLGGALLHHSRGGRADLRVAGSQEFHDITTGTNTIQFPQQAITITGYRAAPGWDPATGWGSPNAHVLAPCSPAPQPTGVALDGCTDHQLPAIRLPASRAAGCR